MTTKYANGAVGAAGELVAQARLLMRSWTVGNVNTGGMMNAPAIDLFAAKGSKTLKLAVKGSGSDCFQWSFPGDWVTERGTIFKGDVRPDFMLFVLFKGPDDCDVYVVPSTTVDTAVMESHVHYHSHPKKDGSPRKRIGSRCDLVSR
jgi:hypothetical protein